MTRPTIVLTGGGTAGHVSVNEALIPVLRDKQYDIHYIGSHDGIEKELIRRHQGVAYHAIQSGKLRRYFSVKNFTDPFRVVAGVGQAYRLLKRIRPSIVFSKGGFVSVPVVLAAKLANIPVVAHESDVTPGLANKISLPFAAHIFTVFESTLDYVPADKSTHVGAIVRPELFEGKKEEGLRLTGLTGSRPVVIVMGGSQGSKALNDMIRDDLSNVLQSYDVIHLCGRGNRDAAKEGMEGYVQIEYATTELPHLLAASDYALTRAGSNAIFELLALEKPMMLIPLSANQSRGDQILNARHFESLKLAEVIEEEQLPMVPASEIIGRLIEAEPVLRERMKKASDVKTPEQMVNLILLHEN